MALRDEVLIWRRSNPSRREWLQRASDVLRRALRLWD